MKDNRRTFSDAQDPKTFDGFPRALEAFPGLRVFESKEFENVEAGSHFTTYTYRYSDGVAGWARVDKTD